MRLLIAGGFHRSTRGLTLALTPLVTPALGTGIPSLRGRCVQNLARGRRRQRRRKGRVAAQRKQEGCNDRVGDRHRRRDRKPHRFTVHETEECQYRARKREGRGIDELLVDDEGADGREHETGQDGAASERSQTGIEHADIGELVEAKRHGAGAWSRGRN